MASKAAIMTALKMLGRAFAGTVDEARAEVYHAALVELSDDQVNRATEIVIETYTGAFIPPPAILINAVKPAPGVVDASAILRRVEKLGTYNPASGMIPPPIGRIAETLGERIAYAYSGAGGPLLFTENEVSRDIARREFQRLLTEAVNEPQKALPIFGAASLPPAASDSVSKLVESTASSRSLTKRLTKGADPHTLPEDEPLRPSA
jgi:hypothetical protein